MKNLKYFVLGILFLLSKPTLAANGSIVFGSDFGVQDDGVAIVKGILISGNPQSRIIDLTHQIPAFSVRDAARYIGNTASFYPEGTVFLTLVDGGAGPRKPIVMKSKREQYFVQPDNGIITFIAEKDGIEEVREISDPRWITKEALEGGHAWRDVYAPVAARLSRGDNFKELGPVVSKYAKISSEKITSDATGIRGEVVALDGPFGNLITNVTSANLLGAGYTLGDKLSVLIGSKTFEIPFVKTFDDVPVNEKLLYIDSTDHLALAINQGNFASKFKIKPPVKISIPKSTKKK